MLTGEALHIVLRPNLIKQSRRVMTKTQLSKTGSRVLTAHYWQLERNMWVKPIPGPETVG